MTTFITLAAGASLLKLVSAGGVCTDDFACTAAFYGVKDAASSIHCAVAACTEAECCAAVPAADSGDTAWMLVATGFVLLYVSPCAASCAAPELQRAL